MNSKRKDILKEISKEIFDREKISEYLNKLHKLLEVDGDACIDERIHAHTLIFLANVMTGNLSLDGLSTLMLVKFNRSFIYSFSHDPQTLDDIGLGDESNVALVKKFFKELDEQLSNSIKVK